MTIEIALLIAGGVLVSCLIWQLHWVISPQLSEIRYEVNALRDVVSRVFLIQVAHKTESEHSDAAMLPPFLDAASPPPTSDPIAKNDGRENDALQQLEFEVGEVDELCARLITLVPPKEAAPLLSPDRAPSGLRERRLVPRHPSSTIGKILHHGRAADVCTVSNTSPAGALLFVADASGLPEQFDLHVDGYRQRCIARWRGLDRVGVKFKSIAAA